MKTIIATLFAVCLFSLSATTVAAQTINKKSLMSDLNNADGMTMDSKQKKEYESINTNTANSLLEMDKKTMPKDDRDKEVDKIFDKRDNDVDKLWGKDSIYEDTRKTYKKKTRSLRLKIKAAKLVM
jgi:hypothetical protein